MFIVIGGATGSGKSSLAVETAKRLNGEVISADSMQIYKKMSIGTAKITESEMQGVPHHLIDIVEQNKTFSVAEFAQMAKQKIKEIEEKGKVPIICGGTGLYINALIYDYQMSKYDNGVRIRLYKELEEEGIDYMYEELLRLDPLASQIHKSNVKRVIRALEVIQTEGKSIFAKNDKENCVPHIMYALDIPRDKLYDKINSRVDLMFEQGLCEEVDSLLKDEKLSFDMQSMQAIGYKEFNGYLKGEYPLNTLVDLIKQHTRNYAKRQITWFKRIESCVWLKNTEKEDISAIIEQDYYNYKANLK